MNRGLIFLLIFVFIFSSGFAFVLESLDKVDFNGFNGELNVKVSNDSNQAKRFKVEFFSPVETKFEHLPLDLNSKETRNIAVKFTADENQNNTEYVGLLKVKLGEEEVKKQVKLSFQKTELKPVKTVEEKKTEMPASEKKEEKIKAGEEESQLVGLASFVQTNLLLIELIVDAVLLVIAAVLLIMFISRFVKRIQVKK